MLGTILCGCTINLKLNVESRYLPKDEPLPKLTVTKPIAVKNISTDTVENKLGACATNFNLFGKLYDFTSSASEAVKEALGRQGVLIDEKAEKVLELNVYEAKCLMETWTFKTSTALRVKTGDKLEKVYNGDAHVGNAYASSAGFETAILDSVSQLLKDKDIIKYLEK